MVWKWAKMVYTQITRNTQEPITTMMVRFLIVGTGLLIFSFSTKPRRAESRGFLAQPSVLGRMVVLGVLRSIELLLWAYALRGTNTFVVNILGNSSPLFVLAASVLIYHEKVPFKVACGLGVTLCGLLIVSLSGGSGGANPLSIVLMLTAALDYTVSLFISRDLRTGAHPVPAFVFSHCLGNFLGRPDFIAWCPEKRNWAVRLCARLGAMMVMWTALPEHDTQKLEAENDAVIFQWYAPKQQYK